ncbi:OLC1v1034124C1 [Oldenlandia corymbosa var. corymbosa]|uniref:OLC1v1034124C1 n=1 Tax=Oldenlandia corymbosa var. corymbosa TaxID=529605 RepID=A0AAV1CSH1_OLDCO|nr:OLC1v1034124C1 [Oldenlandia corymbosa var. corymbosa]
MVFAEGQCQMLPCLKPSPSTAPTNSHTSPPFSQGSLDGTPFSSVQTSPTYNLTDEYTLAVQTNSYSEIWSKIHQSTYSNERVEVGQVDQPAEPELLEQILDPSHEYVSEALSHIRQNALTNLVATYFDHSESTSRLCLRIYRSVHRARLIYAPLAEFLDILPVDIENGTSSLSQIQCDRAFDIFLEFDQFENPFPSPGSYNFDDMRRCFSELRQELDKSLQKSRLRMQRLRCATGTSVICLIAATVGVVISAITIATHAFAALVATPLCAVCLPTKLSKRELAHLSQIEAAAKGTYVLHNDLDTIDRLVVRLHTAFEGDKLLIRLGLERGRERHPIQEVVKQLRKTLSNFMQQLSDLDEHLCLCFAAINRARSLLLGEVHLHSLMSSNIST